MWRGGAPISYALQVFPLGPKDVLSATSRSYMIRLGEADDDELLPPANWNQVCSRIRLAHKAAEYGILTETQHRRLLIDIMRRGSQGQVLRAVASAADFDHPISARAWVEEKGAVHVTPGELVLAVTVRVDAPATPTGAKNDGKSAKVKPMSAAATWSAHPLVGARAGGGAECSSGVQAAEPGAPVTDGGQRAKGVAIIKALLKSDFQQPIFEAVSTALSNWILLDGARFARLQTHPADLCATSAMTPPLDVLSAEARPKRLNGNVAVPARSSATLKLIARILSSPFALLCHARQLRLRPPSRRPRLQHLCSRQCRQLCRRPCCSQRRRLGSQPGRQPGRRLCRLCSRSCGPRRSILPNS